MPAWHDPWSSFPRTGTPAAPLTGPFPFRGFLSAAWEHRSSAEAELHLAASGDSGVAVAAAEGHITFVGEGNLTDYHAPVGDEALELFTELLADRPGRTFRFDSLPAEAVSVVTEALKRIGATHTISEHAATAVLDLPDSFDQWLASIGKKERHEVRRKRRRFDEAFGEATIVEGRSDLLPAFCSMHRSADGDKGSFMTNRMVSFFKALLKEADATIHLLECDGRPRAGAFGWETDDGYFYYNSALDREALSASPGVVLFTTLIEYQIERGAAVVDFLKGDETYKYRHGARRRPLYAVEGVLL
ncbi:MAG: GNAT family N-acetyltransferase [Acidimicrobiia bacterium]